MDKRYTSTAIEVPEGYVVADPDDLDVLLEHDLADDEAGSETGLSSPTTEEIKQAINEVADAMMDEALKDLENYDRELAACTTEEERRAVYDKYEIYPMDENADDYLEED